MENAIQAPRAVRFARSRSRLPSERLLADVLDTSPWQTFRVADRLPPGRGGTPVLRYGWFSRYPPGSS